MHLFHVIAVTEFGTPACLPVIFQKGNNFGAVLFASLDDLAHPKWPFSDRTVSIIAAVHEKPRRLQVNKSAPGKRAIRFPIGIKKSAKEILKKVVIRILSLHRARFALIFQRL